ncbi:hypothetical protein GGF43_006007, partial [Coemansia sp. RSA 2618]
YTSQDEPVLRCKVLAKPLVGVFKTRGAGPKKCTVEKCMLRIEQGAEEGSAGECRLRIGQGTEGGSAGECRQGAQEGSAGECRLVVRVAYKEGVCRTHRMFYEVGELLHPVFDQADFKSHWRVGAKAAGDWISHFSRGLEEVSFWMSASEVRLRSWSEGHYAATGRGVDAAVAATERALLTELMLAPAEFDAYSIAGARPVELTFSLRELRAALQYADATEQPMTAQFNRGGDPLVLTVSPASPLDRDARTADVTAEFIIATRTDYGASQSESFSSSAHATPYRQQNVAQPATIQSADTPPMPLVCERVDEISMHTEDRQSTRGVRRAVPSPSPYQSSRGSNGHDMLGLDMEIDRTDSLLNMPNSSESRPGSNRRMPSTAHGGVAIRPEQQTPVRASVSGDQPGNATTAGRSYRLLDMPRPHAPPGVTEAMFGERRSGAEDTDTNSMAPPGKIQTRLPYQNNNALQRGGSGSETGMSSDEELEATPPPPSKRLRSLF